MSDLDTGFAPPPPSDAAAASDDDEPPPPLEDVQRDPGERPEAPEEAGEAAGEEALDKEARRQLFRAGGEMEAAGDADGALNAYLGCLRGVRPDTAFPEMPRCLRAVAEIHFKREQYEKAVHFIQAEKLYYEAALLDTSVLQRIISEGAHEGTDLQAMRAAEYESLARFCLDKKELQLALEYAAKAAQLREAALGEEHPETTRSLDFVTTVYAELGKQEYADSLERFDSASRAPAEPQPGAGAAEEEEAEAAPARGRVQTLDRTEREIRISLVFFTLMIFVTCAVLTVVSCYAYCKYLDAEACDAAASFVRRHFDWLHFLVHQWTA